MKIQDEARDFLDITDAEKADGHLRHGVARLHDGIGADDNVTSAAIALEVVNGNNVGGSAGSDGASAAASDDEDALVRNGVNGLESFEISEKRRANDTKADEQEGQAEEREKGKDPGNGVCRGGFRHSVCSAKSRRHPEEGKTSKGNTEKGSGKRGQRGAAGVGGAGPLKAFARLEFGLSYELSFARGHGASFA